MRVSYTPEQIQFIKDNYLLVSSEIARLFNEKYRTQRSSKQMHGLRKRLGLRTGRSGKFEPGHIPSPLCYLNSGPNAGTFKKGNRPHNTLLVGSEITTTDGYLKVKTAEPNQWEFKHLLIWTERHQAPSKDETITFIDGNQLNCCIDNLQLLHRSELLFLNRNGYKDLDNSLKPTLVVTAKLSTKVHSLIRESS